MESIARNFKKFFFYLNALIAIFIISITFIFCLMKLFGEKNIPIDEITTIVPIIMFSSLFMHMLGAFKVTTKKRLDIVISSLLAVMFSDVAAVIIIKVFSFSWFTITEFIVTYIIQMILVILWAAVSVTIYRFFKKPQKAVIVCYDMENIESYIQKILKQKDQFNVTKIVNYADAELYQAICENDVVFLLDLSSKKREKVAQYCFALNKEIYILPGLYEISIKNSSHVQIEDIPYFVCKPLTLTLEQKVVKRCIDIIISLIGLIVASPLMLAAAICIKVHDHGPILFTQERVTENYRKFKVFKFRTMVVDAEKYSGAILSTKDDPRITKVGKLLRATRIDELPQLINVLIGDMSFIGPRPERDVFIQEYIKDVPEFVYRLNVKGGLTGLAQVMGKYNTTPQDKLKLDLLYIQNYSLALDMKILFQTIQVVFSKESTEGVDGKGTDWYKNT